MNKNNFRPVIKAIFLAGVAISLVTLAFLFEFSSQYHSSIWIVCATFFFFLMIILFRLTRMRWTWSVLAGSIAVAIYTILGLLLNYLLDAFLTGWLMG